MTPSDPQARTTADSAGHTPAPASRPTAAADAPDAPSPPHAARCANCEAALAGPFCSACGQEAHGAARSLGTLLHDVWHVLTHLDGRVWRTLGALAFRPGMLTAEYLRDRRARYLPPFRLYLVLSVVFFALAALGASGETALVVQGGGAPADAARAEATRRTLDDAARELEGSGQGALAAIMRAAASPQPEARPGALCAALPGVSASLAAACERAAADRGRALGRAFLANVPKTMFLFLPLLALVLFLLFRRGRPFYVEHLVLVLHLQSAMFLLASVALALGRLAGAVPALGPLAGAAVVAGWAYATWYAYRALRVVYGEGRRRTLAKLGTLGFAYAALLGVTLVGTALLSALTA